MLAEDKASPPLILSDVESRLGCIEKEEDVLRQLRHVRLRRNLFLVPAVRALRMMLFGITVNVTYFQSLGVSMWGVFILKSVHSIGTLILEVPSGVLSDCWGRKPILLISQVSSGLYWYMMGSTEQVLLLAVAQALLAIGDSCFNGTDKAVLYESLAELGLGSDALKGESHATFIAQVTESVASIAGGYLAVGVSLKFAIICTSVPYVISSVLTLFILETSTEPLRACTISLGLLLYFDAVLSAALVIPLFDLLQVDQLNFKGIWKEVSNPTVWGLLPVWCFLAVSTYTAVWYHQPLWARAGMPLAWYGWAWAAINLAVAFSALGAVTCNRFLGVWRASAGAGLWCSLAYAVMGLGKAPWVVVAAGCSLNMLRGVVFPIVTVSQITTELNHVLPSERRATILSMKGILYNTLFSSFSQVAGYVANSRGLTPACLLTGLFYGGCTIVHLSFAYGCRLRCERLDGRCGLVSEGGDDERGVDQELEHKRLISSELMSDAIDIDVLVEEEDNDSLVRNTTNGPDIVDEAKGSAPVIVALESMPLTSSING